MRLNFILGFNLFRVPSDFIYMDVLMYRIASSLKLLRAAKPARVLAVRSMAYSVDFEVHGRVQGVFFRACTQEKAKNLGLVGWVMNTPRDTVKGVIQIEDRSKLDKMMVGWNDYGI